MGMLYLIQVKGVEILDANAAVSAIEICSINLYLAVGNEFGLVRVTFCDFCFLSKMKHKDPFMIIFSWESAASAIPAS